MLYSNELSRVKEHVNISNWLFMWSLEDTESFIYLIL